MKRMSKVDSSGDGINAWLQCSVKKSRSVLTNIGLSNPMHQSQGLLDKRLLNKRLLLTNAKRTRRHRLFTPSINFPIDNFLKFEPLLNIMRLLFSKWKAGIKIITINQYHFVLTQQVFRSRHLPTVLSIPNLRTHTDGRCSLDPFHRVTYNHYLLCAARDHCSHIRKRKHACAFSGKN